jgi:hypothetical protein
VALRHAVGDWVIGFPDRAGANHACPGMV